MKDKTEKKLDEINKKLDLLVKYLQENFDEINDKLENIEELGEIESPGTIQGAIAEIKNITK